MNGDTFNSTPWMDGSRREDTAPSQGSAPAIQILIADDDPLLLQFVAAVLQDNGFAVDTAMDGEQAWDKLRRRHYDLLITDYEMPRLNGIKLVERARHEGFRLPVILVSGTVTADMARTAPELRIVAVLPTPVYLPVFLTA